MTTEWTARELMERIEARRARLNRFRARSLEKDAVDPAMIGKVLRHAEPATAARRYLSKDGGE